MRSSLSPGWTWRIRTRDTDDNGATVITAGIGIYMSSKAWFRIAYERQDFQAEGSEDISGVRSMLAVSF